MANNSFTIIEHTADIGIHARGADIESLFEECARGMVSVMMDTNHLAPDREMEIRVDGDDDTDLLYAFLAEILYLFDGENFIPIKYKNSRLHEGIFTTTARGLLFNPEKHRVEREIKAVTFHGMNIKKNGNNWETDVIFDI